VTTFDDLAGRLFASTTETASIIGRDERTVRKVVEAGVIPATRVGAKWSVPVAWIRQQAGVPEPSPDAAAPDPDELADRVADRVVARLAEVLAAAQPEAQAW
jgi:hypothetical protein